MINTVRTDYCNTDFWKILRVLQLLLWNAMDRILILLCSIGIFTNNWRPFMFKELHYLQCMFDENKHFDMSICQMQVSEDFDFGLLFRLPYVPTIFATLGKKDLRTKWTIYKHVSEKNKKCLSDGNFGILSVVCCLLSVVCCL